MKAVAGLLFLLAIGMALNAIDGKWAFDRTQSGGGWVALDLVIAVAFVTTSYVLWVVAKRREIFGGGGVGTDR